MLFFTRSLSVAISQIEALFFWFALLVLGFGIQFGLFTYLKTLIKTADFSSDGGRMDSSEVKSTTFTAANTGMSGVSMVACCAHHLTDVLPLFGLAGLSLSDETGQVYGSAVWEGTPPGGHHREGTLTFNDNLVETKSVSLILRDIAGISKREFNWQL